MFKRQYKIRKTGDDGLNIIVSLPREVLLREAENHNISLDEFIKRFKAVAQIDNIKGVLYTFEEIIK